MAGLREAMYKSIPQRCIRKHLNVQMIVPKLLANKQFWFSSGKSTGYCSILLDWYYKLKYLYCD
jgi:hypothetical protein